MNAKAVISLVVVLTVAATVGAIWMLVVTNPSQIGPVGVTLWFVLALAAMTGIFTFLFFGLRRRFNPMGVELKQLTSSWREAFLIAMAAVSIVALQSLRQLSWRDFILIVILVGLVEFYFRARR